MNHKHPDDEPFTDDELREMEAALHLVHAQRHALDGAADHDEDDNGKVHYERVKGVASPGSFRLPHHVVHVLGQGDPRTAGRLIASLFGTSADDPLTIPPETVRHLGHGDIRAGHRVLQRFVQRLRSGGARSQTVEQPDGNRGRTT